MWTQARIKKAEEVMTLLRGLGPDICVMIHVEVDGPAGTAASSKALISSDFLSNTAESLGYNVIDDQIRSAAQSYERKVGP